MLQTLADGKTILSAGEHEKVARHYGVSSVYLSKEVRARMDDGRMTWKEFGGTHPKAPGNQLAADLAVSILDVAWKGTDGTFEIHEHPMPELLEKTSFVNGQLLSPEVSANEDWVYSEPDWKSIAGAKRERYLGRPMLHASSPGAETQFAFEGSAVGVFINAGPDAGQVDVQIDNGRWKTVDLFHRYSKGLHYPRTVMFATDLKPGPHSLRVKVSDKKNSASQGHAVRIIGFAVNGTQPPAEPQ